MQNTPEFTAEREKLFFSAAQEEKKNEHGPSLLPHNADWERNSPRAKKNATTMDFPRAGGQKKE